ncbi:MAG: DEAD/DEAH box helicase family protein [Planctomycetota bacterium]|nr:DEAD/DEAH box helicase family protein [Planctomycetota bacterium]
MDSFPYNVRFKLQWRPYQQRVLEELETHLENDKLHVIAPPGSGKTVLGLEVVCRLNQPTLVLAPTITIRNQWVDRFVDLYVEDGNRPDWISTDIRNPGFLTVATYQGLHTAYTSLPDLEEDGEEEEEDSPESETRHQRNADSMRSSSKRVDICEVLKKRKVQTIVVDEAHHLKNEWWKTLTAVKDELENAVVVALTATPPYDVSYNEWQRYKEFCGPVDTEISVPELILEDNLCPHQDYVYFSHPTEAEFEPIREFRLAAKSFFEDITTIEPDFPDALSEHPWMQYPEEHIQSILDDPAYFSSLIVFLNHLDWDFQKEALEVLGVEEELIPILTFEWLEILFTGVLFNDRDNFEKIENKLKEFQRRLSRMGAIDRKKVRLLSPEKIAKTLPSSLGKLGSIVEIVRLEHKAMGSRLRLVVLADFICKAEMPKFGEDEKQLTKIGVVPIFEILRREYSANVNIGILCGTLVVVPDSIRTVLDAAAYQMGIDTKSLRPSPLEYDGNYLQVEASGQSRQLLVRLITQLFTEGHIHVLVGTKSLLGEGWDAPAINTLILATYVGSYVLSNQMRGRAIRTDQADNEKAANIWHLVCLPPEQDKTGSDFETLTRRFKGFVGVSFKNQTIESGIHRLSISAPPYSEEKIVSLNEGMIDRAVKRDKLRQDWFEALGKGSATVMIEEVQAPSGRVPGSLFLRRTQGAIAGVSAFTAALAGAAVVASMTPFGFLLVVLAMGYGLPRIPRWVPTLWRASSMGIDAATLHQIGQTILQSLLDFKILKLKKGMLQVKTHSDGLGTLRCSLSGGTAFEKSLFLDVLEEVIKPVENPRYLIAWRRFMWKGLAYNAVPRLLGQKREIAEHFFSLWQRKVGDSKLIYTRTSEGRKHLVKARLGGMSEQKSGEDVVRTAKWR